MPPKAAEEWHTCEVRSVGNQLQVVIDDVDLIDATDAEFNSGRIGLAIHPSRMGLGVRSIELRRL